MAANIDEKMNMPMNIQMDMPDILSKDYWDKMQCYHKECIPQETVLYGVKLSRAYVPFQKLCNLFTPEQSLKAGTAFPELYQPYSDKKESKHKISPLREEFKDESDEKSKQGIPFKTANGP